MKSTNRPLSLRSLAAATGIILSLAFGQASFAQNPDFKPEVGQPGKDVVWVPTSQIGRAHV